MVIAYAHSGAAHLEYDHYLKKLILENGLKKICEVGGGANPSLSPGFVKKYNIEYTLLDISEEELSKSPDLYKKIKMDITSDNIDSLDQKFEFVFSRMVAEHVKDAFRFHENVKKLLVSEGIAFHFFPTLWALPYLFNLLIPEKMAYKILLWIDPKRKIDGKIGKFPAYYKSCRGPLRTQMKVFNNWGYDIMEYKGFFGHSYYYRKVKIIELIHGYLTNLLIRYPLPLFTSYAYLVMRKK